MSILKFDPRSKLPLRAARRRLRGELRVRLQSTEAVRSPPK